MILCLSDVLGDRDLDHVRQLLAGGTYVDGKLTAGRHAREVKNNQQMTPEASREAGTVVVDALGSHEVFRSGVLPRRVLPPLFARYEPGMEYGAHVDSPIMGTAAAPLRSDVAVTVFLSDPDSYDGGDLVLETTAGESCFKLPAGAAIAYPATTLHRVAPVTRGVRDVAVTWVQSLVRDAASREILFDLDNARRMLFETHGKGPVLDLMSKSHVNLLRRWAEP